MQKRIKLLRKTLGLTQQEFADRIGIKRNSVASYEIGRNVPMDAVILSICREFSVNEEWLRTGQGEMFLELDREDEITKWLGSLVRPDDDNEFMKKFIHMLSKLNVEDWKVLKKMAVLMAEENKKD